MDESFFRYFAGTATNWCCRSLSTSVKEEARLLSRAWTRRPLLCKPKRLSTSAAKNTLIGKPKLKTAIQNAWHQEKLQSKVDKSFRRSDHLPFPQSYFPPTPVGCTTSVAAELLCNFVGNQSQKTAFWCFDKQTIFYIVHLEATIRRHDYNIAVNWRN